MHAYFPERFLFINRSIFTFFFYGRDSPFSNFHSVPFILNGIQYSCTQYIMDKKVVLFQDIKQEREILNSSDPLVMKERKTSPEF